MTSFHWFICPMSPRTARCHMRSWVIEAVVPRPPLRMAAIIPGYGVPVGVAGGLLCGVPSCVFTVHCVISAGGVESAVLLGSLLVSKAKALFAFPSSPGSPGSPKRTPTLGADGSSLSGLLASSQSCDMDPPELRRTPIVAPVLPSVRPPCVVSLARSPPPRLNMFLLPYDGCFAVR
jgi:hypothetical protein